MHALPLAFSTVAGVLIAPALIGSLARAGHTRENYRGRRLAFPIGVIVPAAALLALVPVMLIERLAHTPLMHPEFAAIAVYCLAVLLLGLIDDTLEGEPGPQGRVRGWRGHGAALLAGRPSTGVLKGAGSLGAALLALALLGEGNGRWLLAAAVLVLATNAFNLLDLRPGRALKVFVLLGAGLTAGTAELRPLLSLGLFAGPALVAGGHDLREHGMLGDTGANLIGALAGLWLVLSLGSTGQIAALAVLLAINVYGELRSISALVQGSPLLRRLDSWGRPS